MRIRLLSLIFFAALQPLVAAGPAAGATPEEIDQLLLDAVDSTVQAAVEHAAAVLGELAPETPLATLDAAVAQAATAAAEAATEESQGLLGVRARAVARKIAKFQQKLAAARALLAANIKPPLKINKAIGKAANAGLKAIGLIRKKFPVTGIGLMEKNARSAGFHGAGAPVDFKLIPGLEPGGEDPCTEVPEITANANPPGALDRLDVFENGTFRVLLGAERGTVTVTVTACGITRNWLLYNYGDRDEIKNAPVQLSGTWSGSYRTDGPGVCGGFTGGWTASFTVDEFGNVSGAWDGDGWSGNISGQLDGDTIDVDITGNGDASIRGKVRGGSVSGSFTGPPCPAGGGRVTGTFQGSRLS